MRLNGFYSRVSTLAGIAGLWFYAFTSLLGSNLLERVGTITLLLSLIWWYYDTGHKRVRFFERFIVLLFLGYLFFTLAQTSILNSYAYAIVTWMIGALVLLFSVLPSINYRKVNTMIYVLCGLLLAFNLYLMYSSMTMLVEYFQGFEIFCLISYGFVLVVTITLAAMYYLLSGSEKSRLFMLCSVTYTFAMLLGGVNFFYHDSMFITILARALFLVFLLTLYYYVVGDSTPNFELDVDEHDETYV